MAQRRHLMMIKRPLLDLIAARDKTVEIRVGRRYRSVAKDDAILFRSGRASCVRRVAHVHSASDLRTLHSQWLIDLYPAAGFDSLQNLRDTLGSFYDWDAGPAFAFKLA